MAYRRPSFITARMINPLAMRLGVAGTEVLETTGRRSGEPRRVPVVPLAHDGARFLVSPRGETQWVRNLRASAGACRLGPHGDVRPARCEEVPPADTHELLAAYRDMAGRVAASHFRALPDPADHPVFRVHPVGTGGSV